MACILVTFHSHTSDIPIINFSIHLNSSLHPHAVHMLWVYRRLTSIDWCLLKRAGECYARGQCHWRQGRGAHIHSRLREHGVWSELHI